MIAEEWGKEGINDIEWQKRWEVAFSNGFQRTDNEVVSEAVATDMVGSTAVVVVLSGCQIIASNCGDSRAVLCQRNKAIPLTVDQKVNSFPKLHYDFNSCSVLQVLVFKRSLRESILFY